MVFNYNSVDVEDMEMFFEAHMIRIRPKNDKNFGQLSFEDSDQIYEANEIVFHTPGEHTL